MFNHTIARAGSANKLDENLIDVIGKSLQISIGISLGIVLGNLNLVEKGLRVVPASLNTIMHMVAWDAQGQAPTELLQIAPEVEGGDRGWGGGWGRRRGRGCLLKLGMELN